MKDTNRPLFYIIVSLQLFASVSCWSWYWEYLVQFPMLPIAALGNMLVSAFLVWWVWHYLPAIDQKNFEVFFQLLWMMAGAGFACFLAYMMLHKIGLELNISFLSGMDLRAWTVLAMLSAFVHLHKAHKAVQARQNELAANEESILVLWSFCAAEGVKSPGLIIPSLISIISKASIFWEAQKQLARKQRVSH